MLTTMYWWVPYCPIAERAGKMGRRQPRVNSCVLSHLVFWLILAAISVPDHDRPHATHTVQLNSYKGNVIVVRTYRSHTTQTVQTHQRRKGSGCLKSTSLASLFTLKVKKSAAQSVVVHESLFQQVSLFTCSVLVLLTVVRIKWLYFLFVSFAGTTLVSAGFKLTQV